jgi:acyl phosphate:glycerol-3-phosphate acyltransferase
MLPIILSLLIGYLLGSFPSGYVIGKCRGVDIRQHGSGNIGATNVTRTLGKKWGVLVFAMDVLKGILGVRLAIALLPLLTGLPPHQSAWLSGSLWGPEAMLGHVRIDIPFDQFAGMIAGLGCFLGHCFPVWLGFKGGKGVAVGAGILIGLMPLTAIIGLAIWAVCFKASRYVSLASIIAAISLPITTWFLYGHFSPLFWFALLISLIAIWRHRGNVQRLLAGTESRFERKK